jgi:hypothetical protein
VSESSNSDSAINLSGTATVFVGATDADFREEGVGTISGTTLDLSTGNVFSYTPTADTTFVFSNPPASGTAYGMTLKVTGADVTVNYDISNASYDNVSFSFAARENNAQGIFFKPDGTMLYIIGEQVDDVSQFSLSTPWDISTATIFREASVASQESQPRSIFFKPDGTKMYILGANGDDVNEYNLSTPWDIISISYVQNFGVGSQEFLPSGLFFKPDGTKMYVSGAYNTNGANEYSLSTPWDISTASYVQSFNVLTQDQDPGDLRFDPSGLKMFIIGNVNDSVFEYSLSTAWNISTASYVRSFSVSAQENTPTGFFFKPDGEKMYVIGSANERIYQYSTSSSTPATLTYPASVDWPGGTAPDAPADGETDVLVFYTEDGGTTYYGFQAGDAMA